DNQAADISQRVVKLLLDVVFYTLAVVSIFALWVNAIIWLINFILLKNSAGNQIVIGGQTSSIQILIKEAFATLWGMLHGYIKTEDEERIYPILFLKNKFRLVKFKGTQSTQPLHLPHYMPYQFQTITLQYIDFLRMTALPVN